MLKHILASALVVGVVCSSAFAQQPANPVPDPKMPPMPSMETPDQGEMAKPAGPAKTSGDARAPDTGKKAPKETSNPAKGRSAAKKTPAARGKPAAKGAAAKKSVAKAPARPAKSFPKPGGKKRR